MLSAVFATIASLACTALLVGTIIHGFIQGWLIKTTPVTVAARGVLLLIPITWAFFRTTVKDSSERWFMYKFTVTVTVVFVILTGIFGCAGGGAIALFLLLMLFTT